MKTFRTEVSVQPSEAKISLKTPVLTVGSCFADAIGIRLIRNKFSALVNPFGIIYNPISLHKMLSQTLKQQMPASDTFLINNDVHLNYDLHSHFSALARETLNGRIQSTLELTLSFLKKTEWLLITYGTAWVYARKDSGEIVANCHKMPASTFTKTLLSEAEIVESFRHLYELLTKFNPQLRVILTVSPVRHIKDTLELNSVSKAIVRTACHRISEMFSTVEYFPAYEMMIDDLRDYRFYKSDLLHPTEDAEDYIWEKFSERYFDKDTQTFITQWHTIRTALSHKPFHPNSLAHQRFLKDTLKKLESLQDKVDISEEATFIKSQISAG